QLLDPKNGSTFYTYDKNDRLIKLVRPMKQETTYEYDEIGNQTAVIDSKGQRIEYVYDAANRLTQVNYFSADNHGAPLKTVDFTYDAVGNLQTWDDGVASGSYTYDDLNRKLSESTNYGPFTLGHEYTYFANGLKKSFTGPDGESIGYSYDENNRLTGISIPGQGHITYGNHNWNSPTTITMPGGSTTEINHDNLMRIESIISKNSAQTSIMSRAYQHTLSGNLKS
ncbi:MAG: RHS repeat protein, partial [Desulfobacterales bacterium]|nr:RHS repeat protein [Desulfobacterales bacterium]